jgi:peptide-methionine (S)-S-oxide reductase
MAEREIATLGGGCFWCLEAVYTELRGVLSVRPGYMGGHVPNPTYRAVCTGTTGHVEVVEVAFDPAATSYREMLEVFFAAHDPTSVDRQGDDVGVQYRSAIFTHSDRQRETALDLIAELEREGAGPIVTEVRPAAEFYVAEDYHHEYFRNHSAEPYCALVVAPKLAHFRQQFAARRRQES